MKKIFCVGELRFPNGSASANYVERLADALARQGAEVIVISTPEKDWLSGRKLERKNVQFRPIIPKSNRILRHIQLNYRYGCEIVNELKKYGLSSADCLITYNTNPFTLIQCRKYAKKIGCKICGCITERLSGNFFEPGIRGRLEYGKYLYATKKVLPSFDLVFPISHALENYYRDMGANTFRVPILANAEAYDIAVSLQKKSGKKKYIFPANGKIKDELSNMIHAFLNSCEPGKAELHITGISRERVESLLSAAKINADIFVHGWLKYSELMALYDTMDFLFLARDVTQMTVANFPSKIPEAMCHGVIPVVSRVGDYTSCFLTDGYDSVIFDGCSQEVCEKAISDTMKMSRENMETMAKNAYHTVDQTLNPERWGKRVLSEIERLSG